MDISTGKIVTYLDGKNREIKEKEFLDRLNQVSATFYDIRKELEHILIIAHSDADGYACAALLQRMAAREGIEFTTKYYSRKGTWSNYLNGILPEFDKFDNFAVFFADLGSEVREINGVFEENDDSAKVFILDHHEMENFNADKIRNTVHILNPTLYGYDGLKEIAGSTLVYMFTKEISLKNIKNAWIGLIGISNDTLMNVADYRSFNRMVLEEAQSEEQIIIRTGLMLYGATHENLKNALAHSLFPFVKEVGGNVKNSSDILDKLGIDKNIKVAELSDTDERIDIIDDYFQEPLKGQFIEFTNKKSGLLKFAFEHGLIISILSYKYKSKTEKLISSPSVSGEIKIEYKQYINNLTKNLGLFVKTPKEYTKHAIFVDAGKRIPTNFWSDVASYASVNSLYNPDKVLFLGGQDGNVMRYSVRCSEDFPSLKIGKGIDELISKLKKICGGVGGGHKLAGGYKIAPNKFKMLKSSIDDLFPL